MSGEKNLKKQRKAFREMVKNLIYLKTSNPFVNKEEVSITLPKIQGMNEDNIKPVLKDALGYVPKILLFQETSVPGDHSQRVPVVLVVIELK